MATPFKPAPVRRVLNGVESIDEAHEIQRRNKRFEQWPYEWKFEPPDSERVHVEGNIDVQTVVAGTQTIVLEYQVQNNYRFWFVALVQIYVGQSGFTPGDGNIVWFLDINTPLVAGATIQSLQGYPVQGFDRSGLPKGGFATGFFAPWRLRKPEELAPLDTLRSKVTITPQISQGQLISIFEGWLVPV